MIWGRSVCNEQGALYHYEGPQSASDIGTPGAPQIASVIGTGGHKIGGSLGLRTICWHNLGIIGRV